MSSGSTPLPATSSATSTPSGASARVGQYRAAPAGQYLLVPLQRQLVVLGVLRLAGGLGEVGEAGQVDLVAVEDQPVSGPGPDQGAAGLTAHPVGFEHARTCAA
jgi:hypothetical protein